VTPEDERELFRKITRIDKRVGLVGNLFGTIVSMGLAYIAVKELEQSFGLSEGWAVIGGILTFFVAGFLFQRDFDRN
jgi:hypothetical protein